MGSEVRLWQLAEKTKGEIHGERMRNYTAKLQDVEHAVKIIYNFLVSYYKMIYCYKIDINLK